MPSLFLIKTRTPVVKRLVKRFRSLSWLKTQSTQPLSKLSALRSPFSPKAFLTQVFSTKVGTVLIFSAIVSGAVGTIKQLGALEALELRAYDHLVRWRPDQVTDPRIVLVTITEADLQRQQRSTLTDATIAQVLATLEQHQPAVIGLDLHRDLPQPPGQSELQAQLRSPRLIAITKLDTDLTPEIPAPPGVPVDRIGFNNLPIDPDGVVRRSLIFAGQYPSFSFQLAQQYLKSLNITATASSSNSDHMQLGAATFIPLEADSGGYQVNDASGYQMLLNYRTRQYVGRQLTLQQVLDGQIQPDWIKGKIVLIGTTAASARDLFHTPYTAGLTTNHQLSGVEIHAQATSQIISAALNDRPLLVFLPNWTEWLWLWLWALVAGTIATKVRQPLKLAASSALLFVSLASITFLFFLASGWVPVVAPTIAALVTLGATIAQQAQQARQQQQMMMTLLGQSTSKEIATALWNNRDRLLTSGKLPGQKLTATLLFTDIQNFSTISESIPPETLLEWLNDYLGAMTQEIQRYQGIINKFTGDGLLAVFGVPVPRLTPEEIDRDAYNAVACALAMGDRLSQLNQVWQQQGLPVVQMRVGISTGAIVVGSLGSKERMEYGVIGDTVNTASRLESCAKDKQGDLCRVLISGATFQHIQGKFVVENWGEMAMKGKHNQVEVYHVIDQVLPTTHS